LIFSVSIAAQDEEDIFNVGKVQYTLQDYIGCIETMNGILKKNPKNGEAWSYKALSKFYLGDYRGAQADMKIATQNGAKYENRA
jgi:lipoprotein NlpI